MKTSLSSRRSFIGSGIAGILASGVAPRLMAADAASKKMTLGCIGVGKHGLGVNLNSFLQEEDCRIVAVCDVFKSRRARAAQAVNKQYGNKDCAEIADFRDMLARTDIDGVVISTPDHWHVTMAMMALTAGKHVFCEKPTLTIAEGRQLADAVAKQDRVFATGLEDRSLIHYHKLAEIVRNGGIGKLRHIEVSLPIKPTFPKEEPTAVPEDLNYEMWLGPAPFRPYSPSLTNDQVWRQIRDFSGGSLTDWGAHLMDTAQVGNFAEDSGPVGVSGKGVIPADSINTVPREYELNYTYENGATMRVTAAKPAIRFEGEGGWVAVTGWDGPLTGSDDAILRQRYDPKTTKIWPRPPREHRNFLDTIKGTAKPNYSAEGLHRLSTVMHLGAIAMELGKPLKWDPKAEGFDDAQANQLRQRESRNDWAQKG